MTFKELKAGYPIYLLHKAPDSTSAVQGKVVDVSLPHLPRTGSGMNTMQMVVDVTVEENGTTQTYNIPDSLSVAYAGENLVLTTEVNGLLKEVEALKSSDEAEIAKVEMRQKRCADCDAIMAEWNPAFKERQETEERFRNIEKSVGEIKGLIEGLVKQLK